MDDTRNGSTRADAASVIRDEKELIQQQRTVRGQDPDQQQITGIAISGGGIRSASFALGVLQALNASDYLKRFDYLSTVSGGGYIGSSWSWFNRLKRLGQFESSGDHYFFPFGSRDEGSRTSSSMMPSKILGYLRQHGNYLVPGAGLNYLSGFATVLRNMVLPLLVYLSLAVVFFSALVNLEDWLKGLIPDNLVLPDTLAHHLNLSFVIAGGAAALLGLVAIINGPLTFLIPRGKGAYKLRVSIQRLIGILAGISLFFVFTGLLPIFIREVPHAIAGASGGGILGIFGGLWHFARQQQGALSSLGSDIIALVSSIAIIIAILSPAYFIADHSGNAWWVALAVGCFFGFLVNINLFGLGRMYRDRLMETFLPDADTVGKGHWQPAWEAATTELTTFCTHEDQGPYHLINTNLILVDDTEKKFRSRGGDNFILSSLYAGSDATGWTRTGNFDDGKMTLATAMATSGAAANPYAGPNSQGMTRSPVVSFLMFILGLRLGLYVRNPNRTARTANGPSFMQPGLLQGLFGVNFKRSARFLALSDGGHFENTAAYELIRRRADLILISEAGQDEQFGFADVANLIERVRVDFGVHIRFMEDYDLKALVPGSAIADDFLSDRYGMAKRGFAFAEIEYPPEAGDDRSPEERTGLLVLVKATLTADLPADLYGYKDTNPTYPNQTTLDQFFDETQFESYRELGYQLTKQLTHNEVFERWWTQAH
ncbi:MAG: patatin-like phospholipase family protein [Proteobacteria bacterium]|nr:patatin-like phospholipase family protein [Pseudomonadota bacterium]